MKRRVITFIFLLIACLVNAQKDSIKGLSRNGDTGDDWWYHRFTFGGGVGYSLYFPGGPAIGPASGLDFPIQMNQTLGDIWWENVVTTNVTPPYSFFINYKVKSRWAIGLVATYQKEEFTLNQTPTDEVSRLNMALRSLWYLNKPNKLYESYIGIRLGCSYWRDVCLQPPNASPFYPVIGNSSLYRFSFQVLFGMTFYVTNWVGLNLEAGIGTPYLAQANLQFKI